MNTKVGLAKASKVVTKSLAQNPEIQLILEIAKRARDVQSSEPPRELDLTTSAIINPTNSQCPV